MSRMRSVEISQRPQVVPVEEQEISIKLFLHRSNGNVTKHRVRGRFDWAAISNFILNVWAGSHMGNPVVIEYKDDEGDVISVTSDVEWTECLRVYLEITSHDGRPLHLDVHRKPTSEAEEWSGDEATGCQSVTQSTVMHFREDVVASPPKAPSLVIPPTEKAIEVPPKEEAPPARVEEATQVDEGPHPPAEVVVAPVEDEFVRVDVVPVPPHVEEPKPAAVEPVVPLSPRSEATEKLRAIFPDMCVDEAHFLLHLHGNDIQTVVAWKLGQ